MKADQIHFNLPRLRQWLADNERSAAWLARTAGVPIATMKRVMAGNDPSLGTFGAIVRATRLPASDFLLEVHEQEAQRAS